MVDHEIVHGHALSLAPHDKRLKVACADRFCGQRILVLVRCLRVKVWVAVCLLWDDGIASQAVIQKCVHE